MTRSSCDTARVLAALRPDGVLSETEERQLSQHVTACASCRSLAVRVEAVTSEIRRAPQESPASLARAVAHHTPRWWAVRPRPSVASAVKLGAAGAAIVVATIAGRLTVETPPAPIGPPAVVVDATLAESDADMGRAFHAYAIARNAFGADPPRRHAPGPIAG